MSLPSTKSETPALPPLFLRSMTLSFASISLGPEEVGAPSGAGSSSSSSGSGSKRKAPSRSGHYGLSIDSTDTVHLVALSRLMRAKDGSILEAAARSPAAAALLQCLRAAVLRVAAAAHRDLTDENVATLFNLSGSTVATRGLYQAGFTLPTRLPHAAARALVAALLDGLTEARTAEVGYAVALLLQRVPPLPLDDAATAEIAALCASVEAFMAARLAAAAASASSAAASASSAASSASGSSASDPPQPPPGAPVAPLPMPEDLGPAAAASAPPFAIDAAASFGANLQRLLAHRLRRSLTPPEAAAVPIAASEGLSILQAGDAQARERLLATPMGTALSTPGAAQLWASAVEAVTESQVDSVEALLAAVVSSCSNVAGAVFAAAIL